MVMTSFNADTDTPSLPVNALTVVPFSTGTLIAIAVRLFCLPVSVVARLVLPRIIVGAVTVPVKFLFPPIARRVHVVGQAGTVDCDVVRCLD